MFSILVHAEKQILVLEPFQKMARTQLPRIVAAIPELEIQDPRVVSIRGERDHIKHSEDDYTVLVTMPGMDGVGGGDYNAEIAQLLAGIVLCEIVTVLLGKIGFRMVTVQAHPKPRPGRGLAFWLDPASASVETLRDMSAWLQEHIVLVDYRIKWLMDVDADRRRELAKAKDKAEALLKLVADVIPIMDIATD